MHQVIQETLNKIYDKKIEYHIPILYGGSVNKENINKFLKIKNVYGVLVGKSASTRSDFLQIIKKIKGSR